MLAVRQQDIGRLEIAVHDVIQMGVVHAAGHEFDQSGGRFARLRLAVQPGLQRSARDEFQRQIDALLMFEHFVDLDDVRMLQAAERLGFGTRPRGFPPPRRAQAFERHHPIQGNLSSLVDDAHAAAAQPLQNFEAGQRRLLSPVRRRRAPWPTFR